MSSLKNRAFSVLLLVVGVTPVGCSGSSDDAGGSAAGQSQAGTTQGGAGSSATGGKGNTGGTAGKGGAGGNAGGAAGKGGAKACVESEAKTGNDADNCGSCGHSCLGGLCAQGACAPLVLRNGYPKNAQIAVDDTQIYLLDTSGVIYGGPKDKPSTDTTIVQDKSSKDNLAALADGLYWKTSPNLIDKAPKAGGAPVQVLAIDHFGPDVVIDAAGIYFTTQYALNHAPLSGQTPTKLLDAPDGSTFAAPHTNGDHVVLRVGAVGLSKETQLVQIGKKSPSIHSLATLPDSNYGFAAGPDHALVARRPSDAADSALCSGAPAGEIWAIPYAGGDKVVLATKQGNPRSILGDNKSVYWRDFCDGSVWRASLGAATQPVKIFAGAAGASEAGLAQDENSLYFTFQTKLYRLAKAEKGALVGTGGAGGAGGAAGMGGAAGSGASSGTGQGGSSGTCSHDPCSTGDPLDPSCSACAADVCSGDSFCCKTSWDASCVSSAQDSTSCSCGGAGGTGQGGSGQGGSSGSCNHDPCTTGDALDPSCSDCAATVCDFDSLCCFSSWDSFCVSEAGDSCSNVSCGLGGTGQGGTGQGGSGQGGSTGSCNHDECTSGDALDTSCSDCAATVCGIDDFCCSVSWDSLCVSKASANCASLSCGTGGSGQGGTGNGGSAQGGTGQAGNGPPVASCNHDPCTKGGPLDPSCTACTAAICQLDSFCCQNAWDKSCVTKAAANPDCICGVSAGGGGGASGASGSGGAGAGGDSGAGGSIAGSSGTVGAVGDTAGSGAGSGGAAGTAGSGGA
jgi:hypothetical protein